MVRINRILAPTLLAIHVLLRIAIPGSNFFIDLILFHAISLWAAFSIFTSRTFDDQIARVTLGAAIVFWSIGSILSTYNEFFSSPRIHSALANTFYLLFYPCAFIGIPRTLRACGKLGSLEILDATILGLGLSAIGAAFLIEPVLPYSQEDLAQTFVAILFPIADLVLVALVLALTLISPPTPRSALITAGIAIFLISDFLFLWLNVNHRYSLGALTDDLWLLGIVLLALGMRFRGTERALIGTIHPLFVALSVMMSATLLSITSLRPGYFPEFILIPTIATLILAFVRMMIALRQARSIGEERVLARTDDLTNLPNRRRFIAELGALTKNSEVEGALLLLDLDGFKPINDLYGHEIGDQLLKEVSLRFTRALPQGALLARLGGDEFGAIVRGNFAETFEVAHALRATLSYPFSIADREIHVGVSVGHVGNDGAPDLLRRADRAMYEAKRQGAGVWSESAADHARKEF
ncbi:MAG TPA: GGDEF domain-containing protein [Candidatus Paceibacterota bacterium]|nr:GGDEF domain-containing protein [Candidatus Paceibacterota bacterium]